MRWPCRSVIVGGVCCVSTWSTKRQKLGATSKPYHHTIPRNVVAGVGSTSRNRSRYGRICAPTAASWPTAMSTRRSTYCRPGRGLRGLLHEYKTRSCGASAPAECHHVLFCYRPTSNPRRRAGEGFREGPVCCRRAASRHAVGESPAQSLSPREHSAH